MIENVLERRQTSTRSRLAVKTLVSAGIVVLATVLPQIAHMIAGAEAGMLLMPMYLPVLLGGCLLGTRWGLAVGVISPIVSFIYTSAVIGIPMPSAARLPFMMAELAVFAAVSGLFSNKIYEKPILSVPAVISAQLCGRGVFMISVLLFGRYAGLTGPAVWVQIRNGFAGLFVQVIAVPIIIAIVGRILKENGQP